MTTQHNAADEPPARIPRDVMDQHIAVRRAEPWTLPLPDQVPVAALLDGDWAQHDDRPWELRSGHWYVVWEDADDVYELAPPELAYEFTDSLTRWRFADAQVARADAAAGAIPRP